jgi:hypothetical protein
MDLLKTHTLNKIATDYEVKYPAVERITGFRIPTKPGLEPHNRTRSGTNRFFHPVSQEEFYK